MVKIIRSTIITLLISLPLVSLAAITSSVDRTEIYSDESFVLTISISPSDQLDNDNIVLLTQLFNIEQRAQQTSTQNINGKTTSKTDYQFRLSPKQTGVLGIPAFTVGKEHSSPLLISVLDASKRTDTLPDDAVLLTATVDNQRPYVDQPFRITIEVAYKIKLADASIRGIDLQGFDSTVISEDRGTETKNGQSYNVYKQVIELNGSQPGLFEIPLVTLTGQYADRQQGRYVRFSRSANVPAIQVRPIPATYPAGAYWLPATKITIQDQLDTKTELSQGDHIDWLLLMTAEGLKAAKLPDPLDLVEKGLPTGVTLYRNAPELDERRRVDSAALALNTSGELNLPAIRIPWWNVTTDKLEWAEIPEHKLNIKASASSLPTQQQSVTNESISAPLTNTESQQPVAQTLFKNPWFYISIACLLGWILTTMLLLRARPNTSTENVVRKQDTPHKNPWTEAKKYIKDGELMAFYHSLLSECKLKNYSLDTLKGQYSDSAQKTLALLTAHLFSDQENKPTEAQLLALIKESATIFNQTKKKAPKDMLQLYPL